MASSPSYVAPPRWAITPGLTDAPELWRKCIWAYAPPMNNTPIIGSSLTNPLSRHFGTRGIYEHYGHQHRYSTTPIPQTSEWSIFAFIGSVVPTSTGTSVISNSQSTSQWTTGSLQLGFIHSNYRFNLNGSQSATIDSTVSVSSGTHGLLAVFDNGTMRLWVDGQLIGTGSTSFTTYPVSYPIVLGTYYDQSSSRSPIFNLYNSFVTAEAFGQREADLLQRDPFAMFRPRMRRFSTSSSPTTSAISAPYNIEYSNSSKIFLPRNITLFNSASTEINQDFSYTNQQKEQSSSVLPFTNKTTTNKHDSINFQIKEQLNIRSLIPFSSFRKEQSQSVLLTNYKSSKLAPFILPSSSRSTFIKPENISYQSLTQLNKDNQSPFSLSNKTNSINQILTGSRLITNSTQPIDYSRNATLAQLYDIPLSLSLLVSQSHTLDYDTLIKSYQSAQIPYSNSLFQTIDKIIPIDWKAAGSLNVFRTLPLSYSNRFVFNNTFNTQHLAPVSESNLVNLDYQLKQNAIQSLTVDSQRTLDISAILPLAYQGTGVIKAYRALPLSISSILESKQTILTDYETLIENFNQIPMSYQSTGAIQTINSIPYETRVIKEVSRQLNFSSLSKTSSNSFNILYSFLLSANITVISIQDLPVNWQSELRKQNIIPIEYDNAFVVPVIDDPSKIWLLNGRNQTWETQYRNKSWIADNRDFVWIILK